MVRAEVSTADGSSTGVDAPDLAAVRQRRMRLRDALRELEDAISAPARSHRWADDAASALDSFLEALDEHIAGTERPDGLFDAVGEQAPRLTSHVARLRAEHDEMRVLAQDLRGHARAGASDAADVERIRSGCLVLLRVAVRHRQRGSDLLYEAYEVDIAGGD